MYEVRKLSCEVARAHAVFMNYEAASMRATLPIVDTTCLPEDISRRPLSSSSASSPPPLAPDAGLDIRPYFVDPGGGRPESI